MANYKSKVNPFTGNLQLVNDDGILFFKTSVANVVALPATGNTKNDARIVLDTYNLYVWSGTAWINQGDVLNIDWSTIENKPSSSVANIDSAVLQKHDELKQLNKFISKEIYGLSEKTVLEDNDVILIENNLRTSLELQPAGNSNKNWVGSVSDDDGSNLLAAVYYGRVYTSSDYGVTWIERTPAGSGNKQWVGCWSDADGSVLIVASHPGGFYISTDYGITWNQRYPGVTDKNWYCLYCNSTGSLIIASNDDADGRIYKSTDYGVTWGEFRPLGDVGGDWQFCLCDYDGSNLIAGGGYQTAMGLYTSSDGGVTWLERNPGGGTKSWKSAASDADGSFLIVGGHQVAGSTGRIYTSSDGGLNWTERQPAGDVDRNWISVLSNSDGTILEAQANGGRLYISTNSGVDWTEYKPAGDVNKYWTGAGINQDGSIIIASVLGGRIYKLATYNKNKIKIENLPKPIADEILTDESGLSVQGKLDELDEDTHSHSNKTILDNIQEALTTVLKEIYDGIVIAFGLHKDATTDVHGMESGEEIASIQDIGDDNNLSLEAQDAIGNSHALASDNQTASEVPTDDSGVSVQDALDTLESGVHTQNTDNTLIISSGLANLTGQGLIISITPGESLVFGDPVYCKSDGLFYKADADGADTYPVDAIVLEDTESGLPDIKVLLRGIIRDDSWAGWTVGGLIYLSTDGGLTQIQPSATDDVIQVIGRAIASKIILWNPSPDFITHI